jgi:hypothetical protein
MSAVPQERTGEIAMAEMDEGSKGGRRSVLLFSIVATSLTVALILIGVAGKNVTPNPNMAQSNTESPTTGGSQNP